MQAQAALTPRYKQHRSIFVVLLALWVLFPLSLRGGLAQDAIPYVAAGRLAPSHPSSIYAARNGDIFDLENHYRDTYCDFVPADVDCDEFAVAFVASPSTIPIAWLLGQAGGDLGPIVMQFASALMLAGGMWLLWKRLAHRSRSASLMMVGTAVLLTPMAVTPITLGQTSPILFLTVCLGMSERTARRSVANAAAFTAAALLKVFPAVLVAMLIWRRRGKMLAWSIAAVVVLSLGSLLIVPTSVWGDFIHTTAQLSGNTTTSDYNGSLGALVTRIFGGSTSSGVAFIARVVSLLAAATVCWFGMRDTDDDSRWAAGMLALLLVTPLVWWHYLWVAVGALGVIIAAQAKVDDRLVGLLPAAAALTLIPSVPIASGGSPMPVVQGLLLVAFAIAFCVLARRSATFRSG